MPPNTLFLTLSQPGETADTLEALRVAKSAGYLASLTICNSPHSSMVRESDLVMMTQAGPEIGVASTKAFTTQLLSLLLVTLMLGRQRGVSAAREAEFVPHLYHAAAAVEQALGMNDLIRLLAEDFGLGHPRRPVCASSTNRGRTDTKGQVARFRRWAQAESHRSITIERASRSSGPYRASS